MCFDSAIYTCPAPEETEFDALETEIDMELEVLPAPTPSCIKPDLVYSSLCIKPDEISRGAGFAKANEQACIAASNGLGCEFVKEKNVFFPKCAVGYHVVTFTPSLCSYNCPQGWAEESKQCVKPVPAAVSGTTSVSRPVK
jgi:hypothetical protein